MNFIKYFLIIFLLFAINTYSFDENVDDNDYYASITSSAEFTVENFYKPVSLKANDLFEDIKVSAVEAIPFSFLFTFAYLFFSEASQQGTLQPKMKTLEDYKETYIKSAIVFAMINTFVNIFTYYDYREGGKRNEKD